MSDDAPNKDLPDGIYLNLSFEDYLALPRISSSGLTDLMEGPAAFWAGSWMNPAKEDKDSDAAKLGRAYHAARLEPEEFAARFVRDLQADDLEEGSLLTDAAYKEWLKENGHPQTKGAEKVLERAQRVEDLGGPATWHVARAEWEDLNADREWISPKAWTEIHVDAERLRSNPEVAGLISGGLSEVSILWTDPETGVRCKIRPDYLAPGRAVHVKTWDSKSRGKPGNRAIADNFRFDGHYRSGWFYHLGLSMLPELKILDEKATQDEKALIRATAKAPIETWYLFLRRSGIPDIRARRIRWMRNAKGVDVQAINAERMDFHPILTALAMKADIEIRACLKLFNESLEIYGEGEWYPRDMVADLEDDDFNSFWLDSIEDPR